MDGAALWRSQVRDDVLRELTYTAREFSGVEAENYGFVTRLADDPLAEARKLCRDSADRSPDAVFAAKRPYNGALENDAPAQLAAETAEQLRLKGTRNQIEAVAAGIAKRKPEYRDAEKS